MLRCVMQVRSRLIVKEVVNNSAVKYAFAVVLQLERSNH